MKQIHDKKINQYDLEGKLLYTFKDRHEASTHSKAHKDAIISCCLGKVRSANGYVFRFEGDLFQFKKLKKSKGQSIICKICNSEETTFTFRSHLRHHHKGWNTEKYVGEFGEFRPAQLKVEKKKDTSIIECKLCNEKMMHKRQLMYHITTKHKNITKEKYIIDYIFNGVRPLCKCGCGEKTSLLFSGKNGKHEEAYACEYIKGHWDWVKTGWIHSSVTKDLMSEKAKLRIQDEKNKQGFANYHNPELLKLRRIKRKNKSIDGIEDKYNVICLNRDEIKKTSDHKDVMFNFKCKTCNNDWKQKSIPPRCQTCNPYLISNISTEEKEIYDFIKDHYEGKIYTNVRNVINPYELDIYIPDINLAIEYNGLYWHCELNKPKKDYHLRKYNLALDKNIKLIQIFSDEWEHKKDIVKSRLLNLINKTPNKIYARKCEIKEIEPKIKNQFLNNNHIQGSDKSKIKVGLFHNKELISVMTFGKARVAIGKQKQTNLNSWELVRFCNKLNTNVVGGASKLFSYFKKTHKPESIYSFADNRWSSSLNTVYDKLGFKLTRKSPPGYWYTKDFLSRKHRFNFNKGKLKSLGFDTSIKTEKEIMNNIGYYQIHDCGTTRYEYTML